MDAADAAVGRVFSALQKGRLKSDRLTARDLGAFVGKTTSVLYHHWGSLDGFLYAVSERGFEELGKRLITAFEQSGDFGAVAEAFVAFGLDSPDLYGLMFERRYDWTALRKSGALPADPPGMLLWHSFVSELARSGSPNPEVDARLIYAGLHGLVSLAASGRANVGVLSKTDRDVALSHARELVRRIVPKTEE